MPESFTKHAAKRAELRLGSRPPQTWWNRVAKRCLHSRPDSISDSVTGRERACCLYRVPCRDRQGAEVDLMVVIDWGASLVKTVWVASIDGIPEDGTWQQAAEFVERVWLVAARRARSER